MAPPDYPCIYQILCALHPEIKCNATIEMMCEDRVEEIPDTKERVEKKKGA